MKREHREQHEAEDHAELLARDGEHEVRVRVGQHVLDVALARPAPEQATAAECLQRAVHLIVVARRSGMKELLDAHVDVREQEIGADAAPPPTPERDRRRERRSAR